MKWASCYLCLRCVEDKGNIWIVWIRDLFQGFEYPLEMFGIVYDCKDKSAPLGARGAQRVRESWSSLITWQWPRKLVRLSALRTCHFYPLEVPLVLISVRGWVDPRAVVRSEGLCQWKIPMTPTGIEPATFRIVAQHLNHCATAVAYIRLCCNIISYHIISYHIISYHIISYHTTWRDVIWYDMIWYMMWCDMIYVRYDMIRYDIWYDIII